MEFRLIYRGPLAANGTVGEKQAIRRVFHPQLAELWRQEPLRDLGSTGRDLWNPSPPNGSPSLLLPISGFNFIPVVSQRIHLIAHLDILFLRREQAGAVIASGGDLDNRLKTLLDALRIPKNPNELRGNDQPQSGEDPFFCLLEDDVLVTRINITTDRLLEPGERSHVLLVLHVSIKPTVLTWINIGLGG